MMMLETLKFVDPSETQILIFREENVFSLNKKITHDTLRSIVGQKIISSGSHFKFNRSKIHENVTLNCQMKLQNIIFTKTIFQTK